MFEKKDSLISIIIALCKLTFILMLLLLYFPVICSVQAFMVRKLPVNYDDLRHLSWNVYSKKSTNVVYSPGSKFQYKWSKDL